MSNNADVVIYLDGVVFHVYKNDMKVVREKNGAILRTGVSFEYVQDLHAFSVKSVIEIARETLARLKKEKQLEV